MTGAILDRFGLRFFKIFGLARLMPILQFANSKNLPSVEDVIPQIKVHVDLNTVVLLLTCISNQSIST